MPEHTVRLKTPALDLSTVDVVFRVMQDGLQFGRLKVSKGGVEWMQKNDQKKAFHMNWEDVDRKFTTHVSPSKTRSRKKRI